MNRSEATASKVETPPVVNSGVNDTAASIEYRAAKSARNGQGLFGMDRRAQRRLARAAHLKDEE